MKRYRETFDNGPGGWWGWISNSGGPKALEYTKGSVTTRSPWWIDYNHAPPGAGYLHMLFCMYTKGSGVGEVYMEAAGYHRFLKEKYPTDFTNARVTVRLRGELERRDANLVFLIQANVGGVTSAWVLTGQPLKVTPKWSVQTLKLAPNPEQWTCLGSRHDRGDTYGYVDLPTVLRDVNCDLMFIMFPLNVVPMGPLKGHPHRLRPVKDYPVWPSRLPEGYVTLDTVQFDFA